MTLPISTFRRWIPRLAAFFLLGFVVLNPNLYRAWKQVQHVFSPESLIQTDLLCLAEINYGVDAWVREHPELTEVQAVERFVESHIRYQRDYRVWGNVEYWPTAEEVWNGKAEDCDGRAILTASILRSRGFASARLVVGLKHMWLQVDENEKKPHTGVSVRALLGPEQTPGMALQSRQSPKHFSRLLGRFLRPAALTEASRGFWHEIPLFRKWALGGLFILLFLPVPGDARWPMIGGLALIGAIGFCAGVPLWDLAGLGIAAALLGRPLMLARGPRQVGV